VSDALSDATSSQAPARGEALACKLQYPDMQSAVEADLQQLEWLQAPAGRFAHGRFLRTF
jgi:predicted unusual protein kinase regulating ubiquinone biosynthesis (AarF/ABC1/UbiB family)